MRKAPAVGSGFSFFSLRVVLREGHPALKTLELHTSPNQYFLSASHCGWVRRKAIFYVHSRVQERGPEIKIIDKLEMEEGNTNLLSSSFG